MKNMILLCIFAAFWLGLSGYMIASCGKNQNNSKILNRSENNFCIIYQSKYQSCE